MDKSILDQLRGEYDTFTGAERKIADYILANQWECQSLGIAELSSECGVAVSTVSVFCRKLGLSGFNDFKIALAGANTLSFDHRPTALNNTEPEYGDTAAEIMHKACTRSQEILNRCKHMLSPDQVERALNLIQNAGQVLFFGQGSHGAVATLAWSQFAQTSAKFRTVTGPHLQNIALSTLSREDVVVYFSHTGACSEVLDAAELIRRSGARLILVTRYGHSPAAEYADAVLLCGADEGPAEFGSSDILSAQIYVIEVLLGCYRLRTGERRVQQKML